MSRYLSGMAASLACLMIGLLTQPAEAIVFAVDDFESYAPGSNLNGGAGGAGFTGIWSTNGDHTTVQTITLVDPNGLVSGGSQAARLQPTTNLGDIGNFMNRPIPSVSDTLYMSMLIRPDSGIESSEFYNFQVSNGATGNSSDALGVGIRNNAGNPFFARAGSSGAGQTTNSSTNISLGTDYLLVAKFSKDGGSPTYNRTDLFINPLSAAEPAVADATAASGAPSIGSLGLFSVRNFNPDLGDTVYIDSLRFADSFADAVSNNSPPPPPPPPTGRMFTLTADADAFVQANAATTNFGADVELLAKNQGATFSRKSYIRFDLSSIVGDVSAAELTLNQPDPIRNFGTNPNNLVYEFNVFGLNDADPGENWIETGAGSIDWNNAPGNDTGSGDGMLGNATLLDNFFLVGRGVDGGTISLNSQAMADFINADTDGLVTFMITRVTPQTSDTVVHIFNSKETGFGATLNLTQPVPEPATVSLLALGAAGLLRRRRRAA